MSTTRLLRPIGPDDHARVLAWNAADVELLAPMDSDRLTQLLGLADTAAIIEQNGIDRDGADAGFVLTFADGTGYDSVNYRWFAARHPHFVYLDRIVIDPAHRRTGLAGRVYDELEAAAATRAEVFCLEVNLDPPNEPSLAFHASRGYRIVGEQESGDHTVALFEKSLLPR